MKFIEKLVSNFPDLFIIFYYKYVHNLLLFRPLYFNITVKIINSKKIKLIDGNNVFFTNHIIRIKRFFLGRGINKSIELLANKYCFEKIDVKENDVVFDVGSNVGEFSKYFLDKKCIVHSFEPDKEVYDLQKLNIKEGKNYHINNLVLSNQDKLVDFYLDSKNASSSLINKAKNKIQLSANRLDTYFSNNNINRIKILKIDAEGAEPEVLEGIGNSLNIIDYIAIDCTEERHYKSPINEVTEILKKNNFIVTNSNFYVVGIRKDAKI